MLQSQEEWLKFVLQNASSMLFHETGEIKWILERYAVVSSNKEMLALQSSDKISCWQFSSSSYYGPALQLPQCIDNPEVMQLLFKCAKANCCGNTLSCAPEVTVKI